MKARKLPAEYGGKKTEISKHTKYHDSLPDFCLSKPQTDLWNYLVWCWWWVTETTSPGCFYATAAKTHSSLTAKNKVVNNISLCFGVCIFGHSEQHHFKHLACLHLITQHESYSTIILLSSEERSTWKNNAKKMPETKTVQVSTNRCKTETEKNQNQRVND